MRIDDRNRRPNRNVSADRIHDPDLCSDCDYYDEDDCPRWNDASRLTQLDREAHRNTPRQNVYALVAVFGTLVLVCLIIMLLMSLTGNFAPSVPARDPAGVFDTSRISDTSRVEGSGTGINAHWNGLEEVDCDRSSDPTRWNGRYALALHRLREDTPARLGSWTISDLGEMWGRTSLTHRHVWISPRVPCWAVPSAINHEYAHLLQARAGLTQAVYQLDPARYELQADCASRRLGSAYAPYAARLDRAHPQRRACLLVAPLPAPTGVPAFPPAY